MNDIVYEEQKQLIKMWKQKYYDEKQELERYKNIVDELENRMLLKINRHYNEKQYVICIADLEELYDRLKELKGSDCNE